MTIRLELCTSHSSSCHQTPAPSSLAPTKHRMETFWYQLTRVVLFVFKKIIRHQFPVSRHHFSVLTLMFGRPQRQRDCKKIHAPSLSECSSYRNQQRLCTVSCTSRCYLHSRRLSVKVLNYESAPALVYVLVSRHCHCS